MNFQQLKPLIEHNAKRSLSHNGIDPAYFDEQELDETLNHSENLRIVLTRRGIRTRAEFRLLMRQWSDPNYRSQTRSYVLCE
jgi:hypothetical protein